MHRCTQRGIDERAIFGDSDEAYAREREYELSTQLREEDEAARESERGRHTNGYRPDETDTFRALNEEKDWERSREEWEMYG